MSGRIRVGTWRTLAIVACLSAGAGCGDAAFAPTAPSPALASAAPLPDFSGEWAGSEVVIGCQDNGAFDGACEASVRRGEVVAHRSVLTQTEDRVHAVIHGGDAATATMTGQIVAGGELELPAAPLLPADPALDIHVRNWRSRIVAPARMDGSYDLVFTAAAARGSVTLTLELRDVTRGATVVP